MYLLSILQPSLHLSIFIKANVPFEVLRGYPSDVTVPLAKIVIREEGNGMFSFR